MRSENFKQVPYTIEIDWTGGVVWLNLPLSKEKIIVSEKESKSISRAFTLINATKDERLREFLRATLNLNNFEDILLEIHYAMESVPDEILDIYESLDRKVYVKIVIEELQNLLMEAAE